MFEPSFCRTCYRELTGVVEISSSPTDHGSFQKETTDTNWIRCEPCDSVQCIGCAADHRECLVLQSENQPEERYGRF